MCTSSRLRMLAVLTTLAAFAVGCGGGVGDSKTQKVEIQDWVAGMCLKAHDFDDAQTEAAHALAEADEDNPEALKKAIDSLVRDAGFALEDFVRDVERIGEPDIRSGSKVLDAFRQHQNDEQKILDKFKSDVNRLDQNDKKYREKVFGILNDVEDKDLRDRLEGIKQDDVDHLIGLIDTDMECSFIVFDS